MHKAYIPIGIALLVILVAIVAYMISIDIAVRRFRINTCTHFLASYENDDLIAEYQGVKTKIAEKNRKNIETMILPEKIWVKITAPKINEEDHILITTTDGAQYYVYQDEKCEECVIIRYKYKMRRIILCFNRMEIDNSYDGLTYDWIKETISPEGMYQENDIIEND